MGEMVRDLQPKAGRPPVILHQQKPVPHLVQPAVGDPVQNIARG